ncbi:MAG: alpha/beta fold hydrolase [Myxococcota bacterium]
MRPKWTCGVWTVAFLVALGGCGDEAAEGADRGDLDTIGAGLDTSDDASRVAEDVAASETTQPDDVAAPDAPDEGNPPGPDASPQDTTATPDTPDAPEDVPGHEVHDVPASDPGSPSPDAGDGDAGADGPDADASDADDAVLPPPPEETCSPPAGCAELGGPWPARTELPIILVHGMAGFENIGPLEYYYGVPSHLRAHGHGVWVSVTDPFNGTPSRASQLSGFVDEVLACTCAEQVNLIAHSQGGLDARYLVSALGYADRVASVTTVATPHHGIQLADIALGLVDGPQSAVVDALASILGGLYTDPADDADVADSLYSVSTTGVTQMAEEWPTPKGVVWRSWAGISGLFTPVSPACDGAETKPPKHGDIVPPALYAAWLLNGGNLSPSDGLVPVASARFGRFRGCIAADHLDEIGQIAGATDFDYLTFYLEVADALADEGF